MKKLGNIKCPLCGGDVVNTRQGMTVNRVEHNFAFQCLGCGTEFSCTVDGCMRVLDRKIERKVSEPSVALLGERNFYRRGL